MKSFLRRLKASLGLRSKKRQKRPATKIYDKGGKFNVGAGSDIKADHVNCDIRPLPGIDIVCRAWELTHFTHEASLVYSRHTLDYLTLAEARRTLKNWFSAIKLGGSVHVVVPNLDFHILQWQRATWTLEEFGKTGSDARASLAGFYGLQHEPDSWDAATYNPNYLDTRKSGYNAPLLRMLIEEAGFTDVETWIEEGIDLHAEARKTVADRERQVAPTLAGIRADHVARYAYASTLLAADHAITTVLDAACGIGYGSQLLAQNPAWKVVALDRDEGALNYARGHYSAPNLRYAPADLCAPLALPERIDAVVSFETIEHLPDAPAFLRTVKGLLRPGGALVCSTPNESTNPFNPQVFPYHIRHYTEPELVELLEAAGFEVVSILHQARLGDGAIRVQGPGDFMIVHAKARA